MAALADLLEAFGELARHGRAAADLWPGDEDPRIYGLRRSGGGIAVTGRHDPLAGEGIQRSMSERARDWLRRLDVYPVIGSTNAELMERARRGSVDGDVCLAELQVQGRGRRGRSWFSPFGANLAMSLGMGVGRPPSGLGGVSLVVGLAVLDALESAGVGDGALKWPNDVLLGEAKLGGILIEMTHTRGTELVIGIGLNVVLPAEIRAQLPRQVADLSALEAPPPRNELAGRIVSNVVEFIGEFEHRGFEPFRAAFDDRHRYHGRECQVLQGEQTITGVVEGVTEQGELLLRTADGSKVFHGGEVSLRNDGAETMGLTTGLNEQSER